MCACLCVCVYIYIYIYIYIYMKLLLRKLHYISIDGRRMLGIVHLNFVEKSSFNFGGNFKFTLLLLYDMGVSCHRHFFLVLLLHQQ